VIRYIANHYLAMLTRSILSFFILLSTYGFSQSPKDWSDDKVFKGSVKFVTENLYHRDVTTGLNQTPKFSTHLWYNSSSRITRAEKYEGAELYKTEEWKYNDKGLKTQWILNLGNDAVVAPTIIKYSEDLKIAERYITKGDSLILSYRFFHDSLYNEIRTESFEASGELDMIKVYTYDSDNRLAESKLYRFNTLVEHVTYIQEGNTVKTVRILNGFGLTETNVSTEKFDVEGNVIEYAYFGKNGEVEGGASHVYTYDEAGNWVRRLTTYSDGEVELRTRKIEYY
jgi:hypothetical protein